MTFEDIKKDKHAREMLHLTIGRIMWIDKIQLPDDIIKDFLHLIDVGGFEIIKKGDNIGYCNCNHPMEVHDLYGTHCAMCSKPIKFEV